MASLGAVSRGFINFNFIIDIIIDIIINIIINIIIIIITFRGATIL